MDHFFITGQLHGESIFRKMRRPFVSYLFAMFTPMDDGAHGDHPSTLTTSDNEATHSLWMRLSGKKAGSVVLFFRMLLSFVT
jgi:hypothetical protein